MTTGELRCRLGRAPLPTAVIHGARRAAVGCEARPPSGCLLAALHQLPFLGHLWEPATQSSWTRGNMGTGERRPEKASGPRGTLPRRTTPTSLPSTHLEACAPQEKPPPGDRWAKRGFTGSSSDMKTLIPFAELTVPYPTDTLHGTPSANTPILQMGTSQGLERGSDLPKVSRLGKGRKSALPHIHPFLPREAEILQNPCLFFMSKIVRLNCRKVFTFGLLDLYTPPESCGST